MFRADSNVRIALRGKVIPVNQGEPSVTPPFAQIVSPVSLVYHHSRQPVKMQAFLLV